MELFAFLESDTGGFSRGVGEAMKLIPTRHIASAHVNANKN